ncbi:MAG TPA: bifunctional DNA-formamidopyrimidine glycosylase/DNA-(apurinic or apyrimidinic site) lyase [Thermomicrobiales bacterium]|nr:bifunctional DNA-formamidopyrimidine glycosylase/DNA-(apurinic or apyrimidinic site) lyase [Thermomicrobiales bacterium]
MPELPEVETARRIVERELTGRTVVAVDLRLVKLFRDSEIPDPAAMIGHTITGARRRAKVLIVDFDGDLSLMVHFKLAGQLAVIRPDGTRSVAGHPIPKPDGDYPHKATHFDLCFDDGTIVYFSDIRQFGWYRLMPAEQVDAAIDAFHFGPEGTGTAAITDAQLYAALQRRSIPIKQAILDQSVVAGVGNIYADEALFRARIHPLQPANSLSKPLVARLRETIAWVLDMGIAQGGAKIIHQRAYPVDAFPAVHGREGESCIGCGGVVKKITVANRGTYFCPSCQRLRKPRAATGGSRNRPAASG